jgi:hypothetical protein
VAVGDYAYVADSSSGLRIVDVQPFGPGRGRLVRHPGVAHGVAVMGTLAYVGGAPV